MNNKEPRKNLKLWDIAKPVKFNKTIISIIFILLLVLIIFTLRFIRNNYFKDGVKVFADGFTIINFVLIVYVIYITIEHNKNSDEISHRQESYRINNNLWADNLKEMIQYFPETYILYNQIDKFDDRNEDIILKDIKPNLSRMKILNNYFSQKLILNLEDFITLKKYLTHTDHISWILTFYYQFQSKIVRDTAERVRNCFYPNTMRVIDEFIKLGDSLKDNPISEKELIDKIILIKLE